MAFCVWDLDFCRTTKLLLHVKCNRFRNDKNISGLDYATRNNNLWQNSSEVAQKHNSSYPYSNPRVHSSQAVFELDYRTCVVYTYWCLGKTWNPTCEVVPYLVEEGIQLWFGEASGVCCGVCWKLTSSGSLTVECSKGAPG